MTGRLAASLLAALALGFLVVGWRSWPGPGTVRASLVAPLAAAVGLGLSSCGFVLWMWVVGSPASFPVVELAVIVALGALALSRGTARPVPPTETVPAAAAPAPRPLLLLLGASAAAACAAFVAEAAANPHGSWDAWMTWNMHARAIVRGGERWGEVLRALPDWSHPDYPLLLPATVARTWTYLRGEHPLGPIVVGVVFTFATAALLWGGLSVLRSPSQGLLAALLLLGTKFFVLHGASQYADIPLGCFFLATLTLLTLAERSPQVRTRLLVLAGVTAGLAAWTKNEGFLFLLATGTVYGHALARTRGAAAALRDARSVALGLAPVLAVVLAFKSWIGAPNDLMADQGLVQTAARLLDASRYPLVAGGFATAVLEVGARGLVPLLLAGYAVVAGLASAGADRRAGVAAAAVVALMLAGYALVLLVAPAPRLETNIRSINRLLLQLWPSMLFAYFLLVRTAEEARRTGWRPSTPLEPA